VGHKLTLTVMNAVVHRATSAGEAKWSILALATGPRTESMIAPFENYGWALKNPRRADALPREGGVRRASPRLTGGKELRRRHKKARYQRRRWCRTIRTDPKPASAGGGPVRST